MSCSDVGMRVEQASPEDRDVRWLLHEHEREMARRYPTGSWAGTGGRKDMVWLARALDERPVGIVAMRVLAADVVEVKHLYVASDARRQGVARALMDTLEAEAHRRKAAVVLETGIAQPEAIALYEARGYRRRGPYEGCDLDDACSVYLTLEFG
jgi:ribosomal protein S18 acetylase RimI-like enzyme